MKSQKKRKAEKKKRKIRKIRNRHKIVLNQKRSKSEENQKIDIQ